MNNEPVAIRYDFDGYGYQYIDSGSGSDWTSLNKNVNGEFLYTHPTDESFDRTASHMASEYVSHRSLAEEITEGFEALEKIRELEAEIAELKNARDYWCLQYKDVFNKLEASEK
jgi:predicted alpha/beta-fold hydrolase